jgi:hypothetical protein
MGDCEDLLYSLKASLRVAAAVAALGRQDHADGRDLLSCTVSP